MSKKRKKKRLWLIIAVRVIVAMMVFSVVWIAFIYINNNNQVQFFDFDDFGDFNNVENFFESEGITVTVWDEEWSIIIADSDDDIALANNEQEDNEHSAEETDESLAEEIEWEETEWGNNNIE